MRNFTATLLPDTDPESLKGATGVSVSVDLDMNDELRKITTLDHVQIIGHPLTSVRIPRISFITKLSYHYAGPHAIGDIARAIRESPCLEFLYISTTTLDSDYQEIGNAIKDSASLRSIVFGPKCPSHLVRCVLGKKNISCVKIMTLFDPCVTSIVRDMVDVDTLELGEYSAVPEDTIVDLVSRSARLKSLSVTCREREGVIRILTAIRSTLRELRLCTGWGDVIRDVEISDMVYSSNLCFFKAQCISINARAVNALTARSLRETRKKEHYRFPSDISVSIHE